MSAWSGAEWYSLLAGVAVKSTVLLAAAWFGAILLRKRAAAVRHLVWTAAFAAVLTLPFFSMTLPAVRLPMFPIFLEPGVAVFATGAAQPGVAESSGARKSGAAPSRPERPWLPNWRLLLMLLWGAGTAAALAQMLIAWLAVWRIRSNSDRFVGAEACVLGRELGIQHDVDVLETTVGSMPMTFGVFRPAVLMPADAAQWSEDRRRMVLLHEFAHLRRGDPATHLLARLALSFYWWNPLAWKACREFLKERERAADDLVLTTGIRASDYAGHLLDIARTMQSTAGAALAGVAMARPSQLEGRLVAILDSGRSRKTASSVAVLASALVAAIAVAPVAAFQARQETAEEIPADVDATIRAATAQKNHEMLDNAAKAAAALRKYEIAHKLLESSLAIRADGSGAQSEDYGVGLLNLGHLERQRGNRAEVEALYSKAVAVIGERPQAAPALLGLGTLALGNKNEEQAVQFFERARAINPAGAGPAMMWLAIARERQNNIEEAESMYKGAMALADSDSDSDAAATILELYARFLGRQGRGDEAKPLSERAMALRKASQTSAAAATPNPSVYRIRGGVAPPTLVSKKEPEYTDEARVARYEGTVAIYVEIREDGIPQNMRVLRGLGLGLNEKAIEAIREWRFKPGTKEGRAVTVAATVEVNYRLL